MRWFLLIVGFFLGLLVGGIGIGALEEKMEAMEKEYGKIHEMYSKCRGDLNTLHEKHKKLEAERETCEKQILTLKSKITSIEKNKEACEKTVRYLEKEYNSVHEKYEGLKKTLYKYKGYINDIFRWLKENATYAPPDACVEGNTVRYSCIISEFHYQSESVDHAKSVSEFVNDGGGDCEDFAIYAAAICRWAKEHGMCVEFANETICPETVRIVCGDEEEGEHCIIKVNDKYIEPQTGFTRNNLKNTWLVIERKNIIYEDFSLVEAKKSFEKW